MKRVFFVLLCAITCTVTFNSCINNQYETENYDDTITEVTLEEIVVDSFIPLKNEQAPFFRKKEEGIPAHSYSN